MSEEFLNDQVTRANSRWVNEATGQGDPERDKQAAVMWGGGTPMNTRLLESLFNFNDLAYVIASALPEWGFRHGWDLTLQMHEDIGAIEVQQISSAMRLTLDGLAAHERQLDAAVWGQAFGGGLVLVGCADGRKSSDPLDLDRLEEVQWMRTIPRTDVTGIEVDEEVSSPTFGQPLSYTVSERAGGTVLESTWHHTRVVRYPGARTTPKQRASNRGWDLATLDRVVSKLSLHDSLWDHTGAMMADGSQGVWSIKGLVQAVANGQLGRIKDRFDIAEKTRSLFRSLLLDADGEKFEYVHRQFGGIDGLLAQSAIRTAAAAQMPVTVLFGQSPAGQNATGESDIRLWYDRVEQWQEDVARPRLERLMELVFRSKTGPTKGVEPRGWRATFRPVRKATPMEQGEIRARQAQVDNAYLTTGVLRPEEVAVSRFTAEGWSAETSIDLAGRRASLKAPAAAPPATPTLPENKK
jgi:uncharacterized protein